MNVVSSPEMLKAWTGEGILWLTRVCQVAWKLGKTPRDWQTGVIISIFKKVDSKQCIASKTYRGISLLSLPGKIHTKCLERKCRKQVKYDQVLQDKLWKVLQEYCVDGQLLRPFKSLHCRPEVCVRVNGKQSKSFQMGVGLRQWCVMSTLLFIVYMNWIDKCSQVDECATIGNRKISRLLRWWFGSLLSSTESGLQRALNGFADAYGTAGMKISTAKTGVLHLSRNPDQCSLQVNGATLKQVENSRILGLLSRVTDGKTNYWIPKLLMLYSAVMRALHYSVVMKRELSKKAKLLIFKTLFVPIFIHDHGSWVMTDRARSQLQACEKRFLRRFEGVTLFNKKNSYEI